MTTTEKYGILVDYKWCTGCHSCEMACEMEHGYETGKSGVKVFQFGPWQIEGDKWQYDNTIVFGDRCNRCAQRTAKGKLPSCVKHCQAKCLTYGTIEELTEKLADHPKQSLYAL